MYKPLLFLLFYLIFATASVAQNPENIGRITGTVLDSVTNEPVGFVTIALRESGKTDLVKTTYTSDKGTFELTGLAPKPYEVVIAFMGFKTRIIPVVSLSAANPVSNLGKVSLAPTSQQLKAVEVTAEKLLIKQDIDKITYEVEADPESKTLTALDMLRKVPLVTVDGQDNIQLKGSGSYKVLVNGKTSGLFARNPSDVFKSMPASTIKSIEVITEPSAKYDAEGVGGIINIITVKQSLGGYNGSVTIGGGLPENYKTSAYATVKSGKFGASVYGGKNTYTQPEADNIYIRKDFRNGGNELRQKGTNKNRGGWQYLSTELSFELDSLNLFTGEVSVSGSNHKSNLAQGVTLFSGSGDLQQAYNRLNTSTGSWNNADYSFDYQRSFAGKPEQLLTLSYELNSNWSDDLTDFTLQPVLNFTGVNARSSNDAGTNEHTGQIDYVQPVGKHTVEAGVKTIIRLSDSDYFYGNINPDNGSLIIDPNLTNQFNYRQDIYAAYSSASFRKDKWGLKAGARLEETRIDANFSSSDTVARQQYLNLIPSVALTRKLSDMSSIKLSYNQRIERPGLWSLNPYINQVDPKNISYGNPELRPVTSHNIDLNYNTFIKGTSVSGSLYHNFTNNSVEEFTVLGTDSVSRSTYANIGQERVIGASFFGNTTLFKKLTVRASLTGNYNWLSSNEVAFTRSNKGLSAYYSGGLTYKLGKAWKLSGNVGGGSSRVTLQGRATGYLYNSYTLSKGFLKEEKLTLSISAFNPFQRHRKWGNEINDPDFYQLTENYWVNQSFNLSISYRFGKLQEGIAKNKRGINNDDVSSGGGNGGGGK